MDRRDFIGIGVAAGALVAAQPGAAYAQNVGPGPRGTRPRVAPGGPVAVVTPNGSTLPWKMAKAGGVKVGHLIAQEIAHEFAPGLEATCWGYNGGTPGPT